MPKALLMLLVPSGLKIIPALTIQAAGSWMIGHLLGFDTITYSLLGVQGLTGLSHLFTHGFRSDRARKAGNQAIHMWLLLAVIHLVDQTKHLPIYLYPYLAGYFIGVDVLAMLKNASDSGLNTPWLDRIFEALKAKQDSGIYPGPRTDSQSIAGFEELQRRISPGDQDKQTKG